MEKLKIKLDTFKWVQTGDYNGVKYSRTRTLKAWQLSGSKQYKGILHDTKNNQTKEIEFYDYWDLIDWISSFDFKFIGRQICRSIPSSDISTWATLQAKYIDNN